MFNFITICICSSLIIALVILCIFLLNRIIRQRNQIEARDRIITIMEGIEKNNEKQIETLKQLNNVKDQRIQYLQSFTISTDKTLN